jgi:hypothetical protein
MAPVAYVTRREFASRRTAFLKARTTSHWPAAGFKANTLRLYTHENARAFEQRRAALEAALPVPELTRLGKTIAGLYDPPHDETSPPDAKRAKATATAKAKDSPLAKMWQRVADYKKKKRAADGDGDGDEEYTPPASGSRKRKPSARGR